MCYNLEYQIENQWNQYNNTEITQSKYFIKLIIQAYNLNSNIVCINMLGGKIMEYTKDVIFNVQYGKNKITNFKFRKE